MYIVLLVTVLVIPIFVSHVYAQTLYVDSRIGDMDKIDESKYRATGVSILRNSDGGLISVARVDATRYLDDPIVDKFLKSNPDFLIKQGTVNDERVSLHEIEANYLYPKCLEEVFDAPYQSTQRRGQFIYSRFMDVANQDAHYIVEPLESETTPYDITDYEYGLSYDSGSPLTKQ